MQTSNDMTHTDTVSIMGLSDTVFISQKDVVQIIDDSDMGIVFDTIYPINEQNMSRAIDVIRNADKSHGLVGSESYFESALKAGYGESRYDKKIGYTPGMNLNEARANVRASELRTGACVVGGLVILIGFALIIQKVLNK